MKPRRHILCRLGFHKWCLPYATAGDYGWWGGAGHHRCHCQRPGCTWVMRWRPGEFPATRKTMEKPE